MRRRLLRLLKEGVLFVASVAVVSLAVDWWRTPEHPVEMLPDVTLTALDGTPVALRSGAPVLLYFWMPRCPVCKHDMPAVKAMAKRYRVVSVAAFASRKEVEDAVAREAIAFPVVWDSDGTLSGRFGVEVFPMFFIYDATGKLRYVTSGYTTQAGLAARLSLASRLGEANPR